MYFSLLILLLIPNVLCQPEYQTLPLRFDQAIQYIKQRQNINPQDILNDALKYSITYDTISSYTLLRENNATTQCELDFDMMVQGISKREMWALKVFDAWGKPIPSGILKGNTYWVGSYDECLQPMYITSNKSFVSQPYDTQYCTLSPGSGSSDFMGSIGGLTLGLCLPSSCNKEEIVSLIHVLFHKVNITTRNLACSTDPANGQKNLTTGAIITIIVLSILGLLVVIGTIIDLISIAQVHTNEKETLRVNGYEHPVDDAINERTTLNLPRTSSRSSTQGLITSNAHTIFLSEFSAWKTLRRIFTMKQKNDKESFPFINGIRVLSLFWVIIGHSYLFGYVYTSNILDFIISSRNISLQFISSAVFSVDTFFALSGFLTTVLFVRHVEKEGGLSMRSMILYYVHRYIRLTPTFLVIVMISINLTPYFGSGPAYPTQQGFETTGCRTKYWWTSIVYVGNIVQRDNLCVAVSWYLHNDMQFHWIAPLALIPFVMRRKPIGFIMCILLILVGIGSIAGLLISDPGLQASSGLAGGNGKGPTFFDTIYVTPWCRLSAYFVGVLTGFIVVNTGRSYRLNKNIVAIGSIIAILFALICLFAMYPDSILVPGIDRTSFIVYQSLSRTVWCLSMGWLFFLCMTNRGGIVNKILSWPIWSPLAKLNYGTYLIHLTIIFIMFANQRIPFYYQSHLVVNNFVSHIFFSYLAAILIVIFIETPFFIIEKKLFKR